MDASKSAEFAHIGKSVVIKGQLSGSEDLYVDGVVEGTIELQGNNLVIGPNGNVRAAINAKGVVVQGKLEGDIRASERTELRKSAAVIGDIFTQRISVEDGAYFKGKVDVQRETAKPASTVTNKPEPQAESRVTATTAPGSTVATPRTAASSPMSTSASTPVTKL